MGRGFFLKSDRKIIRKIIDRFYYIKVKNFIQDTK